MTVARFTNVAFVTLGCPKNEVDSDRMAASLPAGFVPSGLDEADIPIVNTCSFIRDATEESIAAVMELAREWKPAAEGRLVIVAGCMVSRYGDELAASMPEADAFVPVADEAALGEVLGRLLGRELPSADLEVCASGVYWPTAEDPAFALVNDDTAASSDHRLVWVDIALPGRRCPRPR